MRKREFLLCGATFALGACAATVDPASDYALAREAAAEVTGVDAARVPGEAALEPAEIEALLAEGLALDEARVLALRNSRRLQVAFLSVGVAKADFEQSRLLRNPTLGLAYLWPDGGGRERIGGEVVQSLGELWQLEFRSELARSELGGRVLEVAREAALLVVEVEREFLVFDAVRAQARVADEQWLVATQALGLVDRRFAAGVGLSTEVAQARAALARAEVELSLVSRALIESRRRLATLLSLPGDPARLVPLPVVDEGAPAHSPPLEALIARSRERRLDLRAAELAVQRAEASVALERRRARPDVSVGIEAEHPEVGTNTPFVAGFNGSIELPIFDSGAVAIRRAELVREAALEEQAIVRLEAEQEVRAAHATLVGALATLELIDTRSLPAAERSVELARAAFERQSATALDLARAQGALVEARRAQAEARSAVARARFELARVTGGGA
ncbi:MAG: TolC family protein [Planctomycetes bacterium]|nr:TolC family protein [Planctomycetota bacterium]